MALYPHIVSKNVEFQVNFGQSEQSLLYTISKKNNNCIIENSSEVIKDDVTVSCDEEVNALDVSENWDANSKENTSDHSEDVLKIDEAEVQSEPTPQSEGETQLKEEIRSEETTDVAPTTIQLDQDDLMPEPDSAEEPNV